MMRVTVSVVLATVLLSSSAAAQATLDVWVHEPDEVITGDDMIRLVASTTDDVFTSRSAFRYETALDIDGADITWRFDTVFDPTVLGPQVFSPASNAIDLGPLSPGTYRVSANWTDYSGQAMPGADTGAGSLHFIVVPEPGGLALLAAAVFGLLGRRQRR